MLQIVHKSLKLTQYLRRKPIGKPVGFLGNKSIYN